jgi:lysophospholipase L1-like esterase
MRFLVIVALAIVTWGCFPNSPSRGDTEPNDRMAGTHPSPDDLPSVPLSSNAAQSGQPTPDLFSQATDRALQAWTLTQSARSPEDWDRAALVWIQAVSLMQSIPPGDTKRAFAQKKVVEYLRNAAYAIAQASNADRGFSYPTFNSPLLDEKQILYLSYLEALGTPDVLIVGSSRAAQGIDPKELQYALASRGYSGLRIFNFGIHGATAQVVNWQIQELLTPEQLPKLILWVDGSRALNSGRVDRTFEAIVSSPGYQRLGASVVQPSKAVESEAALELQLAAIAADPIPLSVSAIDANGFMPVADRFNPDSYYQKYPYVSGEYDGDYQNFTLDGTQTEAMKSFVTFARSRQIPVVFVNLPLTPDYLDPVRQNYEEEFRSYMQQNAPTTGFLWRDLTGRGLDRNDYFADPSHLNAAGAAAVARQLASDSAIPWPQPKK